MICTEAGYSSDPVAHELSVHQTCLLYQLNLGTKFKYTAFADMYHKFYVCTTNVSISCRLGPTTINLKSLTKGLPRLG